MSILYRVMQNYWLHLVLQIITTYLNIQTTALYVHFIQSHAELLVTFSIINFNSLFEYPLNGTLSCLFYTMTYWFHLMLQILTTY